MVLDAGRALMTVREGQTVDVTEMVLATGALGTASFGIVEGAFKPWAIGRFSLGAWGFGQLKKNLGPLWETLPVAFGPGYEEMLLALYRGQRSDVERTLRQGIRIGLTPENAPQIAKILHTVAAEELVAASKAVEHGETPADAQRNTLGRFELAADARVDAAMRLASLYYVGGQQVAASAVAVALAIITGFYVLPDQMNFWQSLAIGVAAVPLAPIAKDVATAIQSAAKAMKARA